MDPWLLVGMCAYGFVGALITLWFVVFNASRQPPEHRLTFTEALFCVMLWPLVLLSFPIIVLRNLSEKR